MNKPPDSQPPEPDPHQPADAQGRDGAETGPASGSGRPDPGSDRAGGKADRPGQDPQRPYPVPPASDREPPPAGRPAGSVAGRIARTTSSAVLIVLTCILVPVALMATWVHDIALDTDRYVSTVAPLATEPAVQDAAVHRITEAVGAHVDGKRVAGDIATWLRSQGLPPLAADAVSRLGPTIDSAVDTAVTKIATRVVHSDVFVTVWRNANRTAHNAVVHALTGTGRGAFGVSDGTVTLDVGTAVDRVKDELVDAGLKPAARIPQVNKQLVLFHSDELAKFRKGARLLDIVGNWLPVLVVLFGAAGVFLARHRRRALARTALGAAFACLLVAIGLVVARGYYLDHLPPQVQSRAAAEAVFDTLLRFLRVSLRTAIVLGVVIALGAYLIGPGRLPVAVRGYSDQTADSAARWAAGHHISAGRVGAYALAYRRAVTLLTLLIIALVFALWNHPTVLTVLLLVLVLLGVLALLALLAAAGRVQLEAARGAPSPPGKAR
ncbi:hypothetical protein ABT167_30055 [Streptomyces sp. NPDC001792]|uniref:hypothetical protein n=1 Tax=Streptomyces sp. NPDC001792 TaxID=3154524 RepID=UPI00331BCC3A